MKFTDAIKNGFANYANFAGTASRAQYWFWMLFNLLAGLALLGVSIIAPIPGLRLIGALALVSPTVGFAMRRLRDAGFSPKFAWLLLAPLVSQLLKLAESLWINSGATYVVMPNLMALVGFNALLGVASYLCVIAVLILNIMPSKPVSYRFA